MGRLLHGDPASGATLALCMSVKYNRMQNIYQIEPVVGCCAGCDVLWGACPMVTLPLERMASRVAASLCYATGLGPEMVVSCQVWAIL